MPTQVTFQTSSADKAGHYKASLCPVSSNVTAGVRLGDRYALVGRFNESWTTAASKEDRDTAAPALPIPKSHTAPVTTSRPSTALNSQEASR